MKKSFILLFVILLCYQYSYSNSNANLERDGRAKFQFTFSPFFGRWDIPVGEYSNLANSTFGFGEIGLKYLSDWNLGIGVSLGYIEGTLNEDNFLDHYEQQWFSDESGILNRPRHVYFETGWNFFHTFFLYYSYPPSKNIEINFKLGYKFMEIEDFLYADEHEIFDAGYVGEAPNDVYSVFCSYNNSPFSAPNFGFTINYKLNSMLSLKLDIEYFRARTEIDVYIEPDVSSESYPKTFTYQNDLSVISIGFGGTLRLGTQFTKN